MPKSFTIYNIKHAFEAFILIVFCLHGIPVYLQTLKIARIALIKLPIYPRIRSHLHVHDPSNSPQQNREQPWCKKIVKPTVIGQEIGISVECPPACVTLWGYIVHRCEADTDP